MIELNISSNLIEVSGDLKQIPKESGVYFLFDSKKKLIYIGETKNIYKRIIQHLPSSSYRFNNYNRSIFADEIKFISFIILKENRLETEEAFISKYKRFC